MSEKFKQAAVSKWITGALFLCMGGVTLFAGNIATLQKEGAGVYWIPKDGFESFHLTVVGPKGFRIDKTCDTTDISVTEFGEDGLYKFELAVNKIANDQKRAAVKDRNSLENTTGDKGTELRDSGHFRIIDGQPVVDNAKEER